MMSGHYSGLAFYLLGLLITTYLKCYITNDAFFFFKPVLTLQK